MFVPIAAKIVGDLVSSSKIPSGSSVMEMGNQTYSIDSATIQDLVKQLEGRRAAKNGAINIAALSTLIKHRPATKPKQSGVPEVGTFFKALGFSSYSSIDINSDFSSLVMDLNKDLEKDYGYKDKFDLVTNIGVSEHLIGQANFMKNAHCLTKPGGLMIHILPFWEYVNHGFFNYQPRFFLDLASANNYEVVSLHLAERDRLVMDLTVPNEILTEFYDRLGLLLKNDRQNGFVVAVLKKHNESVFVLPLQGKYIKDLSSEGDVKGVYAAQVAEDRATVTKGFFPPLKNPSLKIRVKKKLLGLLAIIEKKVISL